MTRAHHLIMTAIKNRLRPDSYAVNVICNCSADPFAWMRRKFRGKAVIHAHAEPFYVEPNEYIVCYNVFMQFYSELELGLS